MTQRDAELMEASLLAVADEECDIRSLSFERFFAAYPDRRPLFYNYDAATPRMSNETVEMLVGLASDANWVWYQIAALVHNHRNYGSLGRAEYDCFVDCTIEALRMAAGIAWSDDCEDAWQRQGARLKSMIAEAF
jgi:hemoglobin-like flavoprotein